MTKFVDRQKKQDLGIFYTPPAATDFIFAILNIWKEKEDAETGRWQSRGYSPSVIDPSCGEGIFLKKAVSSEFTKIPYIFGADIDIKAFERWPTTSLKSEFRNNADKMRNFFFHQDGLSILKPPNHKYHYRGIKKGGLNQFNAVVGNPPYGGIGIQHIEMISELFWEKKKSNLKTEKRINEQLFGEKKEIEITQEDAEVFIPQIDPKRTEELKRLCQNLLHLEIWQKKEKRDNGKLVDYCKKINGVDFYISEVPNLDQVKQLKSFPIETLFVNLFIQLAKPGGWIAVIIPDGILTNSNSHYVREFIADKAKIEAIVSLPRGAFKQAGTSAKTSILFLRKAKEGESPGRDYPVFLASTETIAEESFNKIVEEYKKFYNNPMNNPNKSNKIAIIKDTSGREALMVRVDKTVKELMEEKPQSRWDAKYWHPKHDIYLSKMSKKYQIERLDNFLIRCDQGDGLRTKKGDRYVQRGIPMISVIDIKFAGIDYSNLKQIVESHYRRIANAQPKYGDILIVRSGAGSIGKSALFLGQPKNGEIGITGHINTLGFKNINPFYVEVFFKTEFGQFQIERYESGVSGQTEFTQDSIAQIKISVLTETVQSHIEIAYKKMSAFHDKAMEAKKKGDEQGYQKNKETAEAMLRDLIAKTESVIRGEREDVV